jgi:hypothetical protein
VLASPMLTIRALETEMGARTPMVPRWLRRRQEALRLGPSRRGEALIRDHGAETYGAARLRDLAVVEGLLRNLEERHPSWSGRRGAAIRDCRRHSPSS